MNQVDESIKSLRERQYVKHQQHIGGRWFLCVTTGYRTPVRRHPSILRQGRRGAETNQEGDCSTTTRVGEAQSRGESNSSEISEDSRCTTVFVSAGPLESRGCPELLRVQPVPNNRRVVFVTRVIVHEEIDWTAEEYRTARIGLEWIQANVSVDELQTLNR
jgi:hypothetical protein